MRSARNRGTCTFVAEKTEAEIEFISHVQQVLGLRNGDGEDEPHENSIKSPSSAKSTPDSQRKTSNVEKKGDDFNNNEILYGGSNTGSTPHGKDSSSSCSSSSLSSSSSCSVSSVEEKLRKISVNTNSSDQDDNSVSESVSSYNDSPEVAISNFKRNWINSNSVSRGPSEKSIKEFFILKTIGRGAFGKVLLVQCRVTGQYHAIKVIEKEAVIRKNYIDGVVNEKRILLSVQHPFLVQLTMHFKDSLYLYFVMEWVSGGDLFFHLRRRHRFSEKEAQFYGGQIALALEYLHTIGIVYRDLKPENILISKDGYIKLTDFGLAKPISKVGRTNTMLGTAEYLAPEIFLQKPYGKSIDCWAYGILLYEMVHGQSPFRSVSETETYEKIISGKIKFGSSPIPISNQLKHLILNLLQDDVKKRYGSESWNDVKSHPWFASLNWRALLEKKVEAPFIPKLCHRGDTRFFDQYKDSPTEFLHPKCHDADTYDELFDGF